MNKEKIKAIMSWLIRFDELLQRAYDSMFDQSDSFKNALVAAKTHTFTHSIGRVKKSETILTKQEFCK